jgi:hypothetical protein
MMATDQMLLVQLTELLREQLATFNRSLQLLNTQIAELREETQAIRAVLEVVAQTPPPGVTPRLPKWSVLTGRIPPTGMLAPDTIGDTDIPLPQGLKAFYINALWLIASAPTRCNLYIYSDVSRPQTAVVWYFEDITLPRAPADGVRVLDTARLDINPFGAPTVLWEGLTEFLPVRVRNQQAAAGGATASFQLIIWYTPAG